MTSPPPLQGLTMTRDWDYALLMLWLVAVTLGLVMVASASFPVSAVGGEPGRFVVRHVAYLTAGAIALIACASVPLRIWLALHRPMLIGALVLGLLVLIPGIGHAANGARRWIGFGPLSLQAAEFAKFAVVIYLAGYLERYQTTLKQDPLVLLRPLALIGGLCLLLLLEPDFGSMVVLVTLTAGVLFLAGARLKHFALIVVVAVSLLAAISVLQPYRMQRMVTFLDPWSAAYGSGYQLTQALIAFGRGNWFGLGLGEGIQKLQYLPEAHNDFIFAVIAEELGLVGALAVLALLMVLVLRILRIAARALDDERPFAGYVAYGVALLLGLQSVINVGVNTGTLPTKGLTLPFISYGGNSLLVCCALIGLVMRVQIEHTRSVRNPRTPSVRSLRTRNLPSPRTLRIPTGARRR
jgi:cell division protein FtsW